LAIRDYCRNGTKNQNTLDIETFFTTRSWTPAREAALSRLETFVSKAGALYKNERNYDYGTEYNSVSCLSPYISRRMVTEDEIIKRVLTRHTYSSSEKFIQEVLWRVYWKGWLEMHPSVWSVYRTKVEDYLSSFSSDARYRSAITGSTGIDCFDFWVNELINTGYLHNHARMWFASIWIFTLKLPWELGAHFFYTHLIDSDPASNTLSWRWVAGIQTKGKYYLASKENIKKYTKNRFSPKGLFDGIPFIENEECEHPLVELGENPEIPKNIFLENSLTIIFEEDLNLESIPELVEIASKSYLMVISNKLLGLEYAIKFSNVVCSFSEGALGDFQKRASGYGNQNLFRPDNYFEILSFISKKNIKNAIYIKPKVGFANDLMDKFQKEVVITYHPVVRAIDMTLYPHARKGFFNFKKIIPDFIKTLKGNNF
jgi:deoxyribodipyrimidine photo-lyase